MVELDRNGKEREKNGVRQYHPDYSPWMGGVNGKSQKITIQRPKMERIKMTMFGIVTRDKDDYVIQENGRVKFYGYRKLRAEWQDCKRILRDFRRKGYSEVREIKEVKMVQTATPRVTKPVETPKRKEGVYKVLSIVGKWQNGIRGAEKLDGLLVRVI